MALTRNFLKSMGLTDEQISAIIEGHNDTVEGLKSKIQAQEDGARTLAEAQAEVTRLTGELEKAQKNSGDAAKVQADFDAYKAQIDAERTTAGKKAAVRKALKGAGVAREEFVELLLSQVDLNTVELEGDAVKESDKLTDTLKQSFGSCFAVPSVDPAPTVTPPGGGQHGPDMNSLAAQIEREYHNNLYGASPDSTGKE